MGIAETRERILEVLKLRQPATTPEIARIVGIGAKTMIAHLACLEEEGRVARLGRLNGARADSWEVV